MKPRADAPWSYRPGQARKARMAEYLRRTTRERSEVIHEALDAFFDREGVPTPKEAANGSPAIQKASKWTT